MGKANRSFKVLWIEDIHHDVGVSRCCTATKAGWDRTGEEGERPPTTSKRPRPSQPHQPHQPPSPPTTLTLYNLLITSKTRLCLGVGMVWSGSKKQSERKSKSGELMNSSSALSIRIQPNSTQLFSRKLKAVTDLINLIWLENYHLTLNLISILLWTKII